MRMRISVIALALFAAAASDIVLAREPESAGKIESQQLFVKELAGDPSKEVNAQSYTCHSVGPCGSGVSGTIATDARHTTARE
jgi:hypothetical protein